MKSTLFQDCGRGRGDLGLVSSSDYASRPTATTNTALYETPDRAGEEWIVPTRGTILYFGPEVAPGVVSVMVPEGVKLYSVDERGNMIPESNTPWHVFYTRATNIGAPAAAPKSNSAGGWLLALGAFGAVLLAKSRRKKEG